MKFSLRDLFWLTAVVGLAIGWFLDHRWGENKEVVPVWAIPTIVLAINNNSNLVEIAVGSDDGLQIGQKVQVYRSNQYLGQMTIRTTTPDRAVGFIEGRAKIRKGDQILNFLQARSLSL
jgi:hypothetical protein